MSESDPRDYRSLGDLLRDAREERKLGLDQVNEATRISQRVIQALETDDLEAASGLIYARGFVRTLALYYDLDPEWLGGKLDALAGETSRPVAPVDDEDDVIAGPVPDPVSAEPEQPTGPKWEVESTRVRHVGAAAGPKIPRNLVWGLVAVVVVLIAFVWLVGGGKGEDPPARESLSLTTPVEPELAGDRPAAARFDAAAARSSDIDPGRGAAQETVAPVETIDTAQADGGAAQVAGVVGEQVADDEGSEDEERSNEAGGSGDAEAIEVASLDNVVLTERSHRPAQSPLQSPMQRPTEVPTEVLTEVPTERPTESPASEPATDDSGAELTDTPARQEQSTPDSPPEEEVDNSGASSRLSSVLRPTGRGRSAPMELKILADGPVQVTLSSDGGSARTRSLVAGQVWTMEGHDHFSLAVSDPSRVSLQVDSAPRSLPASWSGAEWIVYPTPARPGSGEEN